MKTMHYLAIQLFVIFMIHAPTSVAAREPAPKRPIMVLVNCKGPAGEKAVMKLDLKESDENPQSLAACHKWLSTEQGKTTIRLACYVGISQMGEGKVASAKCMFSTEVKNEN